ncbi:hypothetical protein HDU67_003456, partial [Dinochytrium kinnereticum]
MFIDSFTLGSVQPQGLLPIVKTGTVWYIDTGFVYVRQPDEFRKSIPRLQTAGQPNGNCPATVLRPYGYAQQPYGNRAATIG